MMKFKVEGIDDASSARAGLMETDHGAIQTPVFMPVGTLGSVKGIDQQDLEKDTDASVVLGNTYHLFLRPGMEVVESAGGLHSFIGWNRNILTDSGGYQVYSLAWGRKISEDGVEFRSHIDGGKNFLTPEKAIDIQRTIGADLIMAFDECTPYPCEWSYARDSMELTHRWLKRCCDRFDDTAPLYGHDQVLLPIVQGSIYSDLRKRSAETIASFDREANAIGGLSVGEPEELMYEMTDLVCDILPEDKPRYLMGVGTPVNILECIGEGVDMFDCVMPTRNARNGMLFTWEGTINIRNKKWQLDHSPIDKNGKSFVDQQYSKAYLRHLMIAKEMTGARIATLHNISFYMDLVRTARERILEGDFSRWKEQVVPRLRQRL